MSTTVESNIKILTVHYQKYSEKIDALEDNNVILSLQSTDSNKSLIYGSVIRDICKYHDINIRDCIEGTKAKKGMRIVIDKLKSDLNVWRDIKTFVHFLTSVDED